MQTEFQTSFQDATLGQAIDTLRDLKKRRRDIIVPIDRMRMNDSGRIVVDKVKVEGQPLLIDDMEFPTIASEEQIVTTPNDIAHSHISEKLQIPIKYWQRMLTQNPALAAENFNSWVRWERDTQGGKARNFFLRTYMDEPGGNIGMMRALLSDRFMPIDNLSLLTIALTTIKEETERRGIDIAVDRLDLTDKRLYVRFYSPSIGRESRELLGRFRDPNNGRFGGLGQDNGIVSGFILSNSEVGYGSVLLAARVLIAACSNGVMFADEKYARRHLGGKMGEGEYREDTHRANIELIKKQIRDSIARYLSPDFLGQRVSELEEMGQRRLLHPLQAVKNFGQEIGMTDEEIDGALDAFARSGSTQTAFDVMQAVTSYAHHSSPDRRFELETAASQVMAYIDKADRPAAPAKAQQN